MVSPTKKILLMTLLTNACRVILAVVFMVSGFVKAVDPMGFFYKLKDYAQAFDVTCFSDAWLQFFAMLFVAVEFVAGFFLLTGVYRKVVSWLVMLVMLVYTPLTLYIAIKNPVPDCGCFGDALQLTNWETFAKNVFLLLVALPVCIKSSLFRRCISRGNRWLAVVFAISYIVLVEGMSMWHLPVIDFRPFAVGTDIQASMRGVPAQYKVYATYEKAGVQREFSADSLPDASWVYIGGRNELVKPAVLPSINDFSFIDLSTGYDIADDILCDTGYVALLVAPSLETADESRVDKINDLYDYCKENGLAFYAASSSGEEAVGQWRMRTGAEYPIYWADDVMLKTMIRANPGLVLLRGGCVVEKWNVVDVPELDAGSSSGLQKSKTGYVATMRGLRFWLLLFAVPMAFILLADMFFAVVTKKREPAKEGGEEPASPAD